MAIEQHPLVSHDFGNLLHHHVTERGKSPHRAFDVVYTYERGTVIGLTDKNGYYQWEQHPEGELYVR